MAISGAMMLIWPSSVKAAKDPVTTAPAVYAAGNVGSLVAGSDGVFSLDENQLSFTPTEGQPILVSYKEVRNVELGAKLLPKKEKIWKLQKMMLEPKTTHRFLTIDFQRVKDEPQSMTLVLSEKAASQVQTAVEFKTGVRVRNTVASSWWGDSVWKTSRNGNVISPVEVGNEAAK